MVELFRDTLLVMASEIRNLTASRGGVDAKKFALSSVLLRFSTSFATGNEFLETVRPLCVDPSRLDHFVRTLSWDATTRPHLEVSS